MKTIISMIFISCVSCSTIEDFHQKDLLYETPYASLAIKKDGRFTYRYRAELIDQFTEGIWERIKSTLVLNSDFRFKSGILYVEELVVESENINIKIIDEEQAPIELVGITINHSLDTSGITNKDGEAIIGAIDINSIQLFYLGQEHNYILEERGLNHFVFTFKPKTLEEKYFVNSEFQIRHNKLIDKSGLVFKLK